MSLFLSLGHNSSAVVHNPLFMDAVIGYEQERIDRVKSSSAFPSGAFAEIVKNSINFGKEVYVTHWFDYLNPYSLPKCKYVDQHYIQLFHDLGLKIISHSYDFTHHDAHANAALHFLNSYLEKGDEERWNIIVADGFGNNQEVLTLYQTTAGPYSSTKPEIISKKYGYKNSLGLMYQFATSYCDMKENQDEYKFLGYESNISQMLLTKGVEAIIYEAEQKAQALFDSPDEQRLNDDLINYQELSETKSLWWEDFNRVLAIAVDLKIPKFINPDHFKRTVIGFYVQTIVQEYMKALIKKHSMTNVLVAGGLFYNVKLNNTILNNIKGKFCVYPLAGDQGAALGFTQMKIRDLNLGYRNFNADKLMSDSNHSSNIIVVDKGGHQKLMEQVYMHFLLDDQKPFNLFTNRMEFGPRALCNTSTIAFPTSYWAARINEANQRNDVMPFAPVIRREDLDKFFIPSEYERVVGSDKFMVVTYTYRPEIVEKIIHQYGGVMHLTPLSDSGTPVYTARPQVVDKGHFMHGVLTKINKEFNISMLINTSCNFHGQPIIFSYQDIKINDLLTKQAFKNIFYLGGLEK